MNKIINRYYFALVHPHSGSLSLVFVEGEKNWRKTYSGSPGFFYSSPHWWVVSTLTTASQLLLCNVNDARAGFPFR